MNLSELVGLTRTYLNEPFPAFWSDAELKRLLNVGGMKYHARIKNVSRNHFTTRVTFQTVANQEYYQLPSNCKDIRMVAVVETDKETYLEKAYWPNPDRWIEPIISSDTIPRQYYLIGKAIRFAPAPSSVLTIRLYYEARQVEMVDGADLPTFDSDYHDLIAKWAAIEASVKDKKKRPELEALLASREMDLIQDVYHRVNPPIAEAEGYLEGI